MRRSNPFRCILVFNRHPGECIMWTVTSSNQDFADSDGAVVEQRKAADKAREEELELHRRLNLTPSMLSVIEPDGRYTWVNDVALQYFGISAGDITSDDLRRRVVHPDDFQRLREERQRAVASGVPFEYENRLRRHDGEYRWFLVRYHPLKDAAGSVLRWYGGAIDIEDRKRAEDQVRALNEQLIKAQERERMRIAGELHDGVLQQITSLTLRLSKVKRQVPPDSEATVTVTDLQQELIKIGTDIRHISHELHPALLQEAGLPAALSSYCEEFSKVRGLSVSCDVDESVKELPPGAALCLYRIAQEALGNAAKYSKAKKVEVRMTQSDGRVRLSVSDDGVGCDPHQSGKSGGLGVINMRERVLQLQGTFQFDSEPGRGTTVKAEIPFRPAL
jgi:PAS domain S-box-containing protein